MTIAMADAEIQPRVLMPRTRPCHDACESKCPAACLTSPIAASIAPISSETIPLRAMSLLVWR